MCLKGMYLWWVIIGTTAMTLICGMCPISCAFCSGIHFWLGIYVHLFLQCIGSSPPEFSLLSTCFASWTLSSSHLASRLRCLTAIFWFLAHQHMGFYSVITEVGMKFTLKFLHLQGTTSFEEYTGAVCHAVLAPHTARQHYTWYWGDQFGKACVSIFTSYRCT
jgi:hypothetical protein